MAITNNGGRAHLTVQEIGFNIQHLNIRVSSNVGWLVNAVIGAFRNTIRNEINKQVVNVIRDVINNKVNQQLTQIPLQFTLGGGESRMGVDYSLVSNPLFTPSHITIPVKGEIFNPNARAPSAFRPSPTPDLIDSNAMISAIVTDFIPLTLVEQWHNRKQIKLVLADAMLPEWAPIRLQTNSFWLVLPELTRKFPNHTIEVDIHSSHVPTINYLTDGLLVDLKLNMIWNGYEVNSRVPKHLFTTNIVVSCKSTASIQNLRLIPTLLFLRQNNVLITTNIGEFDVKVIDNFMNILYERGLVPVVNFLIQEGLPIPSLPQIALVNPRIVWGNRFLAVVTNIHLNLFKENEDNKIIYEGEDKINFDECVKTFNSFRKSYDISFIHTLNQTYPKEYIDLFTLKYIDENYQVESLCQLYNQMFIF